MMTVYGYKLPAPMVDKYMARLVGQFYKILPIKESEEPSLGVYMKSLQAELLGYRGLMLGLDNDALYISLLSILQYMIDNECDVSEVKREVFSAINICKQLRMKYCGEGV